MIWAFTVHLQKSSYDKANRSSLDGFRGSSVSKQGLKRAGQRCATQIGVPVLTDVHEDSRRWMRSLTVVDVLQTPALLCRQTNFIVRRLAPTGKPVNIKKGQFLAHRAT